MMLTRCPACQTVFRLRPEQLHARRGEVRCGHCFHPFNAIEHALEQPPGEAAAAPAPDFFILEDKPTPMPARPSSASMLDFSIPEPEPEPEPRPAPEPEPEPPFAAQPYPAAWRVDEEAALPKTFPGVLRNTRRPAPPAEPLPAPAPIPLPTDDATASHDATTDIRLPSSSAEDEPGPHDVTHDAATDALDSKTHEHDLARLDATYGRPVRKAHPILRALAAMLVLALTALLGVQTTYLYRTEIARELPGLRALLTQACAPAGCTIPYPQDAERIAIEASDLQAEPGKPGHYLLHATLNNRAEYPQRWPHLELTLTDAGDNPISRRVLAPADWLPADETAEAFPARNAVELRIPFQIPSVAPTGYRIYAFYP